MTHDLEAALSRLGISSQAIVDSVAATVGLGPGHTLLSVGSIAEGLSTSKSDVDLLLIRSGEAGPDARTTDARTTERSWMVGRRVVDCKVLRSADAEDLIRRLRTWAGSPWNITRGAGFSLEERLLLHRLLRGHRLYPAHPGEAFRPGADDLARLKLQVARQVARTIQVDMVGYRDSADYASLVFAAQELLGHAADGLLAGHRLTNPNLKWRSRLLGTLPADWSQPIAIRPTRLLADRVYWQLHRAPAEPDRAAALTHASRCTTFARALFAWAEPRLVPESAIAAVPLSRRHDDDQRARRRLPPLELDVDFRIRDGRATLARLNEFGGALEVSDREFAVLLRCDGQTTAAEAECDPRLIERAAEAGLWSAA